MNTTGLQKQSSRGLATARLGAAIAVLALLGGVLAGCLSASETPQGETEAAGKAVDNAKALSVDANQKAKEANDMTSTGH